DAVDGKQYNCSSIADKTTKQCDADGEGYSEDEGYCDDEEAMVVPGAIEINENEVGEPEGIDNDCDGAVDEGEPPCATDLSPEDPMAFAHAIDVCNQVRDARWAEDANIDARSRGIFPAYGDTYVRHMGPDFMVLSTGIAGDRNHPAFDDTSTDLGNSVPHPDPQGAIGCSDADPGTVNDYTELELVLDVPANANSFSFDFNFMSIEFPEYVCTQFDDTFLAMLQSLEYTGNVSFDSQGNRMSINV